MTALRYAVCAAALVAGVYMLRRHIVPAFVYVLFSPVGSMSGDEWLRLFGLVLGNLALALVLVVLLWDEIYGRCITGIFEWLGVEVRYDEDRSWNDQD